MKATTLSNAGIRRLVIIALCAIGSTLLFAAVAQASTYVVTSKADTDGTLCGAVCTLRQAINVANNHAGADIINFDIASQGVITITPGTALPTITGPLAIEGYTQKPCASNPAPCSKQNTLSAGDDAVLLIEINGSASGFTVFNVAAAACTIRGLVINRSTHDGIYVTSDGSALIAGNFIGTDPTGTFAQPNGKTAIYIDNSGGNVIGGLSPAARNVISGNTYPINGGGAIDIAGSAAANNKIWGNFIGTDKNGTKALNNAQTGVDIGLLAHDNIVGGTTAAARNIISGNARWGVVLDNGNYNTVEGNFIGTDVTGTIAIPNDIGVQISANSTFNNLGDTTAGAGNVISGNSRMGVLIYNGGGTPIGNHVYGNLIGTQTNGTSSLGNGQSGIHIGAGAKFNVIGGTQSGTANKIAFNGTDPAFQSAGVFLEGNAGVSNIISGNAIFANAGLGINLQAPGDTGTLVTQNDLNDSDTGPNNLQNFPVLTSAVNGGLNTTITGTLNSESNKSYRIEFFANSQCDGSGYGEGQVFLGQTQLSTNGNNLSFSVPFTGLFIGQFVTATATDQDGNTSEFSQCKQVSSPAAPGALAFSSATYTVNENGGQATITVKRTGGTGGAVSVNYATPWVQTATPGLDYVATSGTLTWADGDASNKTFSVPIIDDTLDEDDELVSLVLSNPTGGATLGSPSSALLTIANGGDPQPAVSISDVSIAEGNSGTTQAVFNVTMSVPSGKVVTVFYQTVANGSATSGVDYQQINGGILNINPGETSKTISVGIFGDTTPEPDETFSVYLSNPSNGTIAKAWGTCTIINDDGVAPATFQFSTISYSVQEDLTAATITVTRTGDASGKSTVDYATADFTAKQKSDYELASGTLTFSPGETSKTFQVLINEDSYVEGPEIVSLLLSNPTGAVLGQQINAQLTINDDSPELPTNPNDDAQNFVYQQYHDLLNREPDAGGLAYWTGQITQCGSDQNCINTRRKDIAAAFYIELEFQETGYFAYRIQKASFGTQPSYLQFMADRGRIQAGPQLEQSKQTFADAWVQRAVFKTAYPDALPADQFVNKLYDSAGLVGYQNERLQAIQGLLSNTMTRAQVLRDVIETPEFKTREYNPAFVLMQYFGYLRRDADPGGYQFWLNVINNQLPQDQSGYHAMVCGFVTSAEYQDRFSAIHTHGNFECGP